MLVDANILLYAVDEGSSFHNQARSWLEDALNGTRRVGIPWQTYWAFLRISTNPRAVENPLNPSSAWALVEHWMDAPNTWVPQPSFGYRQILGRLVTELDIRANLVIDAALAALCIEHGLAIVSNDSDFARFVGVRWINPLT